MLGSNYKGKVSPYGKADPYVPTITKLILEGDETVASISRKTGVSTATIYGWISGKTRRPCRVTLEFVLNRLGHRMAILTKDARPNNEIVPVTSYRWSPADIGRVRR